ncbi:MAG: phytoene desaturase family protein [Candidatus Nanopelagicales bacterium]
MNKQMDQVDVAIIGAGHNGLVAACYLAQAGLAVTIFEAADQVGGAAISTEIFPGVPARLSKYSYLVSLLPEQIRVDLGMKLTTVKRSVSSFTPDPQQPDRGLVIPADNESALRQQITNFTGNETDATAWVDFYARTARIAKKVFPTLTQPLISRDQMRALIGNEDDWEDFFERPLGEVIEKSISNDVLRGIILTDALIGTFADAQGDDKRANICFLYHVIGNGTGDWNVPVGGMGQVTGQLDAIARGLGVQISLSTPVSWMRPSEGSVTIGTSMGEVTATRVLVNAAPAVLAQLLGEPEREIPLPDGGAQIKVNMLLKRLPRIRAGSSLEAFNGTFHINESYEQLQRAFAIAVAGELPDLLPAEIYCHSLTDPSILSPELQEQGVHTLTLFALHTPHELFSRNESPYSREDAKKAVLKTLNSVLDEPIEDCLYQDASGKICMEVNTTLDIEHSLGIPTGNIFHTPLDWPWAMESDQVGKWGVETTHRSVFLCGSGAARGGGVSGIPGHNAAHAILTGEIGYGGQGAQM